MTVCTSVRTGGRQDIFDCWKARWKALFNRADTVFLRRHPVTSRGRLSGVDTKHDHQEPGGQSTRCECLKSHDINTTQLILGMCYRNNDGRGAIHHGFVGRDIEHPITFHILATSVAAYLQLESPAINRISTSPGCIGAIVFDCFDV